MAFLVAPGIKGLKRYYNVLGHFFVKKIVIKWNKQFMQKKKKTKFLELKYLFVLNPIKLKLCSFKNI